MNEQVTGLIEPGNIDINNRPVVYNDDGTVSTELSMSIGTDKGEVLIPRVVDGKVVDEEQAKKYYQDTGQHLGVFDTPENATSYAKTLHERGDIDSSAIDAYLAQDEQPEFTTQSIDDYLAAHKDEDQASLDKEQADLINKWRNAEIDLSDEELDRLYLWRAQQGTAVGGLGKGSLGMAKGIFTGISKIPSMVDEAAKTVMASGGEVSEDIKAGEQALDQAAKSGNIKQFFTGGWTPGYLRTGISKLYSGVSSLGTLFSDLGIGAYNLVGEIGGAQTPENRAAALKMADAVHRGRMASQQQIDDLLGAKEGEAPATGAIAEFTGMGLGLAPMAPALGAVRGVIPKGAEFAVDKASRAAGMGIRAGIKVGPAVAAATTVVEHPNIWGFAEALPLIAPYLPKGVLPRSIGSLKHKIVDMPINAIDKIGEALQKAPQGQTAMGYLRSLAEDNLGRLIEQRNFIRANATKELKGTEYADAVTAKGEKLFSTDELAKITKIKDPNLRTRYVEDLIDTQAKSLKRWRGAEAVNKVLSDGTKLGLNTFGNLAEGGVLVGGISAAGAPMGQEEAAGQAGAEVGVALAAPFAPLNAIGGMRQIRFKQGHEALVKLGTAGMSDHPEFNVHQKGMSEASPFARNMVNAMNGLLVPLGKQRIIMMPKAEMKEAGRVDPYTGDLYVRSDRPIAAPHEFTHQFETVMGQRVVDTIKDIESRMQDPATSPAYKQMAENYLNAIRQSVPGAKPLEGKALTSEVLAEIGRRVLTETPPEFFYGGERGSDILKRGVSQLVEKVAPEWYNKIKTDPVFGTPVTRGQESGLRKAFFEVGEAAAEGRSLAPESAAEAAPEPIKIPKTVRSVMKRYRFDIKDEFLVQAMHELGPEVAPADIVIKALNLQQNPRPTAVKDVTDSVIDQMVQAKVDAGTTADDAIVQVIAELQKAGKVPKPPEEPPGGIVAKLMPDEGEHIGRSLGARMRYDDMRMKLENEWDRRANEFLNDPVVRQLLESRRSKSDQDYMKEYPDSPSGPPDEQKLKYDLRSFLTERGMKELGMEPRGETDASLYMRGLEPSELDVLSDAFMNHTNPKELYRRTMGEPFRTAEEVYRDSQQYQEKPKAGEFGGYRVLKVTREGQQAKKAIADVADEYVDKNFGKILERVPEERRHEYREDLKWILVNHEADLAPSFLNLLDNNLKLDAADIQAMREQFVKEVNPDAIRGQAKAGEFEGMQFMPNYGYLGDVTDEGFIRGDKFFPGRPGGDPGHEKAGYNGLQWRYNPQTETVYWRDPGPTEVESAAIKDWLKQHGEKVSKEVTLDIQKLGLDKYGTLTDEAHMYNPNNLQFMPSPHPDAIEKAAIRNKETGKIYFAQPGWPHDSIEAPGYLGINSHKIYDEGFLNRKGEWRDRDQAFEDMKRLGQLPEDYQPEYAGEASAIELRRASFVPETGPEVNIGLNVGDKTVHTPEDVIDALKGAGVKVMDHSVHQSGTEPTFVAKINRPLTPSEGNAVAEVLQQEAIAQHLGSGKGDLFGPGAENWKPFNPEYFIRTSGKTLAEEPALPQRIGSPGMFDRSTVDPEMFKLHEEAVKATGADPKKRFYEQKPDTQKAITDFMKERGAQFMPETETSKAGPLNWRERDFNMNPDQLEQFLMFGRMVAGKPSKVRAPLLTKFIDDLLEKHGGTSPVGALRKAAADPEYQAATDALKEKWGVDTGAQAWGKELRQRTKEGQPFAPVGDIQELAKKHGLSPWQDNIPFFQHLAEADLPDLKTATVEDLTKIPGIGAKTARFFNTHTRPEENQHALLDTHILGWLKENVDPKAPDSTPTNPAEYEKYETMFRNTAQEMGMTPEQLDIKIWLDRSGNQFKEDRFMPELQDFDPNFVQKPPMPDEVLHRAMLSAYPNNPEKVSMIGMHRNIEKGTPVDVRIDIPTFNKTGLYAQTIHERGIGNVQGYDSIVRLDGPLNFKVHEAGAEKVREGMGKYPMAVVQGEFNPSRKLPTDINDLQEWTPAGFNPAKHSYFYDKETGTPVTGGSEAVMIDNTAYVRDAEFGNKGDFLYMPDTPEAAEAAIAKGRAEFPESYPRQYKLKKDGSLKLVKNPKTGKMEAEPEPRPFNIRESGLYQKVRNDDDFVKEMINRVVKEHNEKYLKDPEVKAYIGWYRVKKMLMDKGLDDAEATRFIDLLAATSGRQEANQQFNDSLQAHNKFVNGDYDNMIERYLTAYEKFRAGTLSGKYKIGKKTFDGPIDGPKKFAAYLDTNDMLPKKDNGAKYGMHSQKVMRVFTGQFGNDVSGLKYIDFKNAMHGTSVNPVIDIWTYRSLDRLANEGMKDIWRRLPENEPAVPDSDYMLSRRIMQGAADRLGYKGKISEANNPTDLQAMNWVNEKKEWLKRGWSKDISYGDYRPRIERMEPIEGRAKQFRLRPE